MSKLTRREFGAVAGAGILLHPLLASAADDADEALGYAVEVRPAHAGMDREIIDPLLGLGFEAGQDHLAVQILDTPPQDHGVDGHGADGRRRVFDDGIPGGIQVAAGG